MADPLSVSSALLAIITATATATKTLHETIQTFKNHQRCIRQLLDELAGLAGVLDSLRASAVQGDDIFEPLKLPLLQCSRACSEFRELVLRCNKHAGGSRTSFRDWARLRYMDADIQSFASMLAGYKSTIAIAVADANLRSTTVTLRVLNEYKDMIQSTTQDLEDHLEDISDRLKYLDVASPSSNEATDLDLQRIQNEINSTEQCLQICANVLVHINSMHLQPFPQLVQGNTQFSAEQFPRSYAITLNTLQGCSEMLNDTVSKLHEHQKTTQDLPSRDEFYRLSTTSADEIQRLRGELDSTRKRLAVCQEASDRASTDRIHMVEDITMGHDGQQLFVSTLGDLFNVKRATAGDRAIQFVGSISDESLKYLLEAQKQPRQ
ncbi:uncharacterized protein PG998_014197 [Apiospora kogelbergensis]|uniref:uncharacterized protein n=1 Tax=Apiospora kogelbergensis TaxID=1337665 RepID=UPI00312E7784